jgi:hypothetical protein
MVTAKPAVKKYVVKLGAEEREGLNALIQKRKVPARRGPGSGLAQYIYTQM